MNKITKSRKNVIFLILGLFLFMSNGYAQVEKGVTSTGKEVDCSTIDPSVDKTVSEYGKIVTHPRVTRNGKLITDDCGCPVSIDCTNCTDTVNCISITMSAPILSGDVTSAVLQIFSDAGYTTQVGSDITAAVSGGKITATAANLSCYTKYYLRLTLNNNSNCTFDWADSTRDMTMEKVTTCTVASVRALSGGSDLSHEHLAEGTTDQIDSVYDHEGNAYAVVQIGEQCWLKENMRAVTRPNGDTILQMRNSSSDLSLSSPRVYYYENDINNYYKYGCLYNFPAAMDIDDDISKSFPYPHRGICPEGWHVPSDEDWTTLATNAGVGVNTGTGAGKLAGGCDWVASPNSTAPGNYSYSDRNATSFYALPAAGCRGSFYSLTAYANFWSTLVENANNQVYYRDISFEHEYMGRVLHPRNDAYSVRCMRDYETSLSAVVDSVTCTSMMVTAKVTGLDVITGKTVCAYKNADFTGTSVCAAAADMRVSNDSIFATIKNLDCHTRYYIKVTATDGTHPVEGTTTDSTRDMTPIAPTFCLVNNATLNENEFETGKIDSVRDHEGNAYSVVQIGEQCWLKQNMRAITTPSGKTLALADKDHPYTSSTSSVPTYFINNTTNGTADFYDIYGCLYNWVAAMDTTAYGNNHLLSAQYPYRGICPEGWHLPSDDEFTTMANYAVSGNHYGENVTPNYAFGTKTQQYEGGNTHISSMLGADCWQTSTVDKSIGKVDTFRNRTSFSALPGGFWYNGNFGNYLQRSYFWTCSESDATHAYRRYIVYNQAGFSRNNDYAKNNVAQAVRCVRNVPLDLGEIILDTTACTFIDVHAALASAKTAQLSYDVQAYTDATYTTVAGASQVTINATKDTIFAHISNLEGNTHYFIRATAKEGELEDTVYFNESTHCMCKVYRPLVQEDPVNFRNYEWGHEANGIVYVDSVADHEGNRYSVCEVGPQCWIRENIRVTTSPSTGEDINVQTSTNTLVTSTSNAVRYPQARWQNWIADSATRVLAGPVYNWPAMVDYGVTSGNPDVPEWYNNRKGLCPAGWHLQHADEFDKVLVPNLGGTNEVVVRLCGGPVGPHSGDTDSDGYLWTEYTGVSNFQPGAVNNPMRNSSALTFRASGQWCSGNGFNHRHAYHFSSANQTSASQFKYYWIQPGNTTITTGDDPKSDSHNMRCIRDGEISFSEMVIDTISCTTAKFHVKYNNGVLDAVDVSKVKAGASTSTEFIRNNKAAVVRVSNDTIYAEITNLDCSMDYTTFYIKAFDMEYESYVAKATIDRDPKSSTSRPCTVTSVRGNEISSAANQIDSVKDHEDNVYAVVQIGNQCWLKENMRAMSSPSGKTMTKGTNSSTDDVPHYYISTNVNSEEVNYAKYGCLYNWAAAMDTTSGKILLGLTEPRRGICPEGWHVPNDSEWFNLEKQIANSTLVASDSSRTGYSTKLDAGRLAASCDWGGVNNNIKLPQCYNLADRNSTFFSALPSGFKNASAFTSVKAQTGFWTATENTANNTTAYFRLISNGNNGVQRSSANNNKYQLGYSVRCVRDEEIVDTITFVPNGGTGTMAKQMVARGVATPINANTYTHDGNWAFTVWDTIALGSGYIFEDQGEITTNGNITLYAQWHTSCKGTPGTNERGSSHLVDSVEDHEHNWYKVVQIGDQCWLKENMRAQTSPSTGTTILNIPASSSETGKRAYYYDNNPANANNGYGLLYNWFAAMDTSYVEFGETDADYLGQKRFYGGDYNGYRRGVCPEGWHLPADYEWTQLSNYVKSQPAYNKLDPYCESGEWITCGIGKSLASSSGWESEWTPDCDDELYSNTVICNQLGNNATGFTAVPAGRYVDGFNEYGEKAAFWTASPESATDYPFFRWIVSDKSYLLREATSASVGYSVRCVRNKFGEVTKTASTESSLSISVDYCIDNTVTSATLCAYTNAEGTQPEDGILTNTANITESSISGTITGLTAGTYYYVKVTATTNRGVESTKVTGPFITDGVSTPTDGQPCPGMPTVNDHEGNVYNTVQIGTQCWTKENMRCTTSPSTGATILISSTDGISSISGKQAWYYNNQPAIADNGYGLLYNWCAAVDTFNTAYGELSTIVEPESAAPDVTFSAHRRGICPEGWHVPSDNEWTQLTNYVKGQNRYVCDDCSETDDDMYTYCINKALASTTGFYVNNTILLYEGDNMCYPFYKLRYNNSTGFTALMIYEYEANFWSASQQSPNQIYCRKIYSGEHYSSANYVERNTQAVSNAYSVRCVRDN